jgi:hypothetical protein
LPVQNVTPPSEATRTNRPYTAAFRIVHGVTTAAHTITTAAASRARRWRASQSTASGTKNSMAGRIRIDRPIRAPAASASSTARRSVVEALARSAARCSVCAASSAHAEYNASLKTYDEIQIKGG